MKVEMHPLVYFLLSLLILIVGFNIGSKYKEQSYPINGIVNSKGFTSDIDANGIEYNKQYYLIIDIMHLRKVLVDEKTYNSYWLNDSYNHGAKE